MEGINKTTNRLINSTEKIINRGLDNIYINTGLKVFIGLYAAFAAPRLPPSLVNLMDNIIVRISFAFIIVFISLREPSMALIIAIAFVVTLQTANKYRLINTSLSNTPIGEISWLESVKELFFGAGDQDDPDKAVPPVAPQPGVAVVPAAQASAAATANNAPDIASNTINKIKAIACDGPIKATVAAPTQAAVAAPTQAAVAAPTQAAVAAPTQAAVAAPTQAAVGSEATQAAEPVPVAVSEAFYAGDAIKNKNSAPGQAPPLNELQTMNNYMPSNNLLQVVDEIVGAEPNETTNSFNPFTSTHQFINVQENLVPNSRQDSCTGTFSNNMCAQGLYKSAPNGIN